MGAAAGRALSAWGHLIRHRQATLVARRWPQYLPKRLVVHGAFLLLMTAVALHSQLATGADHSSVLYSLVAGDEIIEGPLDPSAYAQSDTPGVGGTRLAAADANEGVDIITFDDPEVHFLSTQDGSAVIAPLSPLEPSPTVGDEVAVPVSDIKQATVYTVASGDTIAGIAEQHNVSVNTILWANGLRSNDILKVGDHLTILPTTGVLHTVRSGDTLSAIASRYDVAAEEIIKYNRLSADGAKLSIGQKVIVPGGELGQSVTAPDIVSRDTRVAQRDVDGPTPEPVEDLAEGFQWPTTTNHISQYFRWGHTGIDIDNRSRPSVFASQPGTVEFAGWLGGYGNLIILNHGGGLQTYYAHLDRFYASVGDTVAKGAAIGKMGSTGRSTGPHLHFEVRLNGKPVNPLAKF